MKRIIIGITGASGVVYGVRALEILRGLPDVETHLVMSPSAARTLVEETDYELDHVKSLASAQHNYRDIGASISSGSFRTEGMLVAPCSIKTLSGIANSFDDELIVRAADVCLKERRRVVLAVRETPLHKGHLELMLRATDYGAVIMPPVPAFYTRPASIDELIDQTVCRALDCLGIEHAALKRWGESG